MCQDRKGKATPGWEAGAVEPRVDRVVKVATKKEVETAPEDGALEVRLEEKSQKFGNRLVACTRRCHGQAGGHAGREAGGGKHL